MAGFADRMEADLLRLLLNATAIVEIADNAASSPITALHVSLHTADPGDTGSQGTNEIIPGGTDYTEYTRIATSRTTVGWSIPDSTLGAASPSTNIDFPQHTATSTVTVTHAAIGYTSAATGTTAKIIASGTLSPTINISQNVTPRLTTGSSFTLD